MNGRFALSLVSVAAITKGRAFIVKEKIKVALMGRVTTGTTLFQNRVNGHLPFRFAFMAHITQVSAWCGQFKAVFGGGMIFRIPFVTDRAFLRRNRPMNVTGFTDDRVAVGRHTTFIRQGIPRVKYQ